MKSKKRKLSTLALLTLLSIVFTTTSVYTADGAVNLLEANIENTTHLFDGFERSSWLEVDRRLSGNNGSDNANFRTHVGHQHFRIHIANGTRTRINVTLTSARGTRFTYVIQPNSPPLLLHSANTDGWAAGLHNISMTTADGSPIAGHIAVRVAANAHDVRPLGRPPTPTPLPPVLVPFAP